MNVKLPPVATLVATLSALGGVVGVILGTIGAGSLTSPVRAVLVAISGLLVAIGGHHASSIVSTKAKALPPTPVPPNQQGAQQI